MAKTMDKLTDILYSQLQEDKFVMLHTVDAETSCPTSSAISWVYAVSPKKIRFAIDARSRLINNLTKHDNISISVIANSTVYAIYGKAVMVTEHLEEVPFKLSCFDLEIVDVRDAMFYGARITAEPEYEKTYDIRAAEKLDQQVFTAMKKA